VTGAFAADASEVTNYELPTMQLFDAIEGVLFPEKQSKPKSLIKPKAD